MMWRISNRTSARLAFAVLAALTLLSLLPMAATAAPPAHWPPFAPWRRSEYALGPMVLVGTVAGLGENELEVELADWGWSRAHRWVTHQVSLQIDEDSILLSEALAPLTLADLQEGDWVLVAPRLAWGTPGVRLLYAGAPEAFADHSFRGRLVSLEGDTLVLEEGRRSDDELTVVVNEETIWLDGGRLGRPAELPEGIPLRVLGIEQEDGTVQAVLVTTGFWGL
ncbi:MAG TPA: hypothetical protein VNK95_02785 [Caldilineaceae bacterium]|nr:hypothetical protein [Caldilineaceae bacterium]